MNPDEIQFEKLLHNLLNKINKGNGEIIFSLGRSGNLKINFTILLFILLWLFREKKSIYIILKRFKIKA